MTASGREPGGEREPGRGREPEPERAPEPGPGPQRPDAEPEPEPAPSSEPHPAPWRRPAPAPLLTFAAVCAALFVAVALTVSLRHGAPLAPERAALHWSTAHHGEPQRSLARALTATGSGPVPYLLAVLAGLLAGRGAVGRLRAVICAVTVLAVGQAIRYGLMGLLARPRPSAEDWAAHASGYAFPSGHATTSALAAGILAWGIARRARPAVARTWCAVLALWAAGVGLTRVYLGVHWPGDVLAGWLLAATLLALALLLEPFARPAGPARPRSAKAPHSAHSHE
ncbi:MULTISPECIES: phosphatase PAP2 family protein [unclassified Streptomyces]|uniref:phosphatase PAP2 family protein n=1 Tax=unclassified Streptomyces TaxID=2593676 RepID=UPI0008923503|nr:MULTISPECIES: phosphatase PAP2 family protein [unclassified Streptomyces]PBC85178.1 undecaprenyl-diphosphatase [Streptomyces sp. 2321.6]SDR20675.1 undecaprenyl-diphosphatase [Streptomyces sp. KS_16]SED58618.1 undecaprenyl-diphosphatase [Streptomyces sp. 2133.1]SNC71200.1 undecaprenyl-diphosphatase [Streptomyces sp. 2114.4]